MLRTMVAVVRGLRDLPAPPSDVGEAVVRRLRKEESDRPPKTARGRRLIGAWAQGPRGSQLRR